MSLPTWATRALQALFSLHDSFLIWVLDPLMGPRNGREAVCPRQCHQSVSREASENAEVVTSYKNDCAIGYHRWQFMENCMPQRQLGWTLILVDLATVNHKTMCHGVDCWPSCTSPFSISVLPASVPVKHMTHSCSQPRTSLMKWLASCVLIIWCGTPSIHSTGSLFWSESMCLSTSGICWWTEWRQRLDMLMSSSLEQVEEFKQGCSEFTVRHSLKCGLTYSTQKGKERKN